LQLPDNMVKRALPYSDSMHGALYNVVLPSNACVLSIKSPLLFKRLCDGERGLSSHFLPFMLLPNIKYELRHFV
jgi:hypothetical protein